MSRILLIIFLSFGFYTFKSQTLLNTLDHDTCLNKKFSIVFYIVLDSNYSVRTATQPTLDAIINTLNDKFSRICVSFQSCSTVFIPNYPYNRWKRSTTDPLVTGNWYTDKTINFYIVDSIKDEPQYDDRQGYAYPPPASSAVVAKDVIVVEQFRSSPLLPVDFYKILHNMGHFFGLAHTYDELSPTPAQIPGPAPTVTSQEFANGSNNTIHGDRLSDTEADPGAVPVDRDGNGDLYIRPLDNYMSFIPTACQYSQQQYNLMAKNILAKRLYLH